MPLTLEIPDSAVEASDLPPAELQNELRRDLAVLLYERGVLPIGKAVEFARQTRAEFERLLKERNARRPFDEQEILRELS